MDGQASGNMWNVNGFVGVRRVDVNPRTESVSLHLPIARTMLQLQSSFPLSGNEIHDLPTSSASQSLVAFAHVKPLIRFDMYNCISNLSHLSFVLLAFISTDLYQNYLNNLQKEIRVL